MEKTKTTYTSYASRCEKCGKRIMGGSESAVKFNMEIHIKTKHGDVK